MKPYLISEILRSLKSNPQVFRKLKIFLAVGLVFVSVLGGIVIWAGYSLFKGLVVTSDKLISSESAQTSWEAVQTRVTIFQNRHQDCITKGQSLFSLQPWMEKSFGTNLQELKNQCLQSKDPTPCEGESCDNKGKSSPAPPTPDPSYF